MVCAFTGHRPERLPWGSAEEDERCVALKTLLFQSVLRLCAEGYDTFLCGMARGCDLYFAECVLAARNQFPALKLVGCIPCPSQADGWDRASRDRYEALCAQCSEIQVCEPAYSPGCMLRRNRAMVDAADRLLTVYDGGSGGTGYTVRYAVRQGKPVEPLWF